MSQATPAEPKVLKCPKCSNLYFNEAKAYTEDGKVAIARGVVPNIVIACANCGQALVFYSSRWMTPNRYSELVRGQN